MSIGLIKKLDDTEDSAQDAVKGMDDANDSAQDLGATLLDTAKNAGVMLAAYAAFDSLKSAIMDTARLTDEVGKLSETYGLNIVKLDAWGAAAARSGGSADEFYSSATSLQSELNKIKFGEGSEIVQTLARMGVSAQNSNGQIKNSFELLESLSGVFEGMDASKSAALGAQLGLDQGTILLLQQGRNGVAQLVEQQEQLGGMTQESYEASALFNDSLDNLDRSFTGVFQTINAAILPALTWLIDGFTGLVQWARKNEDFVVGLFLGVASAITYFALPAVASLAAAVWALAAPFAVPAAIVGGLVTLFAMLYEDIAAYINGQSSLIGDLAAKYGWFKTIVDGLITGFKSMWDGLVNLMDWTWLLVTNPSEAVSQLSSSIMDTFSVLWDWIKDLFDFSFLEDTADKFKSWFGFGDDTDINKTVENTQRIIATNGAYAQNPLNTQQPVMAGGYSGQTYNTNNFSFNNNIQAKGVTSEQVSGQFNDEFGRQVAAAGSLLDDGIDK